MKLKSRKELLETSAKDLFKADIKIVDADPEKFLDNVREHATEVFTPASAKLNITGSEVFVITFSDNDDDTCYYEKENTQQLAEKFINTIPDKPYLIKTRLRRKAWLGSVLSVMFPDGSLKDRNRRLKQVNWEDLENVLNVYSILKDL